MSDIKIEKAVMHILDNKKDNFQCTDFELDLDDKIKILFSKHIDNSQRHDNRKWASFDNNVNVVKNSCIKILTSGNNTELFINESKIIAQQLYDSMKKNASPANLVICKYTRDNIKEIAILKLDFSSNYKTSTVNINGKTKINVEVIETLPGKNDKLQKCVFVNEFILDANSQNHYMMILDKQESSEKEVSGYFSRDFLHCTLINTDYTNTKNFVSEMNKILSEVYVYNQESVNLCNRDMWDTLKNNIDNDVSIPDIVKLIVKTQENTDKVLDKLNKNGKVDFTFNISKEFIEKRDKNITVVTNKNIKIFCNRIQWENEDIIELIKKEDGKVDLLIKDAEITFL